MKRKMLFITFAFIFILLIFCNNSFASSEIVIEDTTFIVPDWWIDKPYKTFFYYDGILRLFGFDDIVTGYFESTSPYGIVQEKLYLPNEDNITYSYYSSESMKDSYPDFSNVQENIKSTSRNFFVSFNTMNNDGVFTYSNFDIYDQNNTLVFQAPPQVEEEITLKTVLEKEKETDPQMVMKEILLILPTILVVVVSYLGLRKALAMLSAILRRS